MTSDMLMQPFEQSFIVNNEYYRNSSQMLMGQGNYMLGYNMPTENLDFRPTFYNPFEIKHRRRTSRAQLKVLEESFSENPKPNATVRRILAQQLDMTPRGVQIWFQNRRAKAKLLRRKSTQNETTTMIMPPSPQQKPHSAHSPHPSHLVNNVSARSVATAAAASCIFDRKDCIKREEEERYPACERSEDWFKVPLHPLAPVIQQETGISVAISADEWRRRSCPAITAKAFVPRYEQEMMFEYQQLSNRRMTDLCDLPKYNECQTPQWNSSPVDFFQTLNYSPVSQQMTPKLSTGSPISVEGGYYDSCLDIILSSSSSPAPML